jgi:predicted aspartyl protease
VLIVLLLVIGDLLAHAAGNTEVKQTQIGRDVEQALAKSQQDSSQSNARLYSVKTRNGNAEVYLKGKIGNTSTFLLLDTGFETSVIGKNLLGDVELVSTRQKLFAANSTEIPVLGETDVTLNIQGKSFETRVTMSDHVDSAILGMDFLLNWTSIRKACVLMVIGLN